MAAVLTIRPPVGVVLAADDDLLAALKPLFDDYRPIRGNAGNAVGVEDGDYVVYVPLRVLSQLTESGAIQQGAGNSIVNVFLDDHVTRGRHLPLELARTLTAYTRVHQALPKTLRNY